MPENEVNKASFWQKSAGGCFFTQTGTLAGEFADTWQFDALFCLQRKYFFRAKNRREDVYFRPLLPYKQVQTVSFAT